MPNAAIVCTYQFVQSSTSTTAPPLLLSVFRSGTSSVVAFLVDHDHWSTIQLHSSSAVAEMKGRDGHWHLVPSLLSSLFSLVLLVLSMLIAPHFGQRWLSCRCQLPAHLVTRLHYVGQRYALFFVLTLSFLLMLLEDLPLCPICITAIFYSYSIL